MLSRTLGALAIGLGLSLTALPAHATDGLQWQWSTDTERTYHVRSQVRLPTFIFFNAFNNIDVRIFEFAWEMVTTCKGVQPIGKKAWEVACTIDDISIQAAAMPGDEGRLTPVAQEWDERLTGKVMQLQFTLDGRVRNVGFDSIERRNRRDGENTERVRQILTRMFSPLDFRMPKNGDDKGIGGWAQKDTLLVGFTSSRGTTGAVEVTHNISGAKGSQVKVLSKGAGTVGNIDSASAVAGQERIDQYKMELTTETFFDTAAGEMIKRQAAVYGTPTASALVADGTDGIPYIQGYSLDLIRAGEPRPTLPESKEVPTVFADAE